MGLETSIGWCDATWNPWRGCEKVSPGCRNCFATSLSLKNTAVLGTWGGEAAGGRRTVAAETGWDDPVKLNARHADRRQRMFVGSMMDFFEDWGGPLRDHRERTLGVTPAGKWEPIADGSTARLLTIDDVRERVLTLIARTPAVDWLILTKRPQWFRRAIEAVAAVAPRRFGRPSAGVELARKWLAGEYPPNVWVGASVENQKELWLRAECLREIPARLRFLSAEPLLEPIDLSPWFGRGTGLLKTDPFDWVIVGGESGNDARPCDMNWLHKVVTQCREHSIPVYVKQLGSNPVGSLAPTAYPVSQRLRVLGKGEDVTQFPPQLQVQEFPDLEFGDDLLT